MEKFKSFFEFVEDYEEYGYIDKISTRYYPLKKLNPKRLNRYYLEYIKKWDRKYGNNILNSDNKQNEKEQSEDSKLSALVRERDNGCRLLKVLNANEYAEWEKNHNGLGNILDAAHVFGKGAFPWMRYEIINVVTLNRYSHNCLDNGKSPINGKIITEDERMNWWWRIITNGYENNSTWEHLKFMVSNNKGIN